MENRPWSLQPVGKHALKSALVANNPPSPAIVGDARVKACGQRRSYGRCGPDTNNTGRPVGLELVLVATLMPVRLIERVTSPHRIRNRL